MLQGLTERINEEFEKQGMITYSLAQKMHTDPSTIREWLRGTRQPKAISLARLCIALDTSADYLLFGKRRS